MGLPLRLFLYSYSSVLKREVSEDGLCNSQSVHVNFSSQPVSLFAYIVMCESVPTANPPGETPGI